MPLQKQPVNVNFAQGIDTKSDKWQIPIGKFFYLVNSVFTKAGELIKRYGFANLPAPSQPTTYVTTFNGNLLAIGNNVQAYSLPTTSWENSSPRPDVNLSTISLVRGPDTQFLCDSVTSSSGLTCVLSTFTAATPSDHNTNVSILDAVTGEVLFGPFTLDTISGFGTDAWTYPRVFDLGDYFVICYLTTGFDEIDFVAINKTTFAVGPTTLLASTGAPPSPGNLYAILDGVVFNDVLYLAYGFQPAGVHLNTLSSTLVVGTPIILDPTAMPGRISVTADAITNDVWITYVDTSVFAVRTVYSTAITTPVIVQIVPPTQTISFSVGTDDPPNITSLATGGVATIYAGVDTVYAYDTSLHTFYTEKNTITNGGVVGTESVLVRSVFPEAKAFFIGAKQYFLALYFAAAQSTLFLIDGDNGQVLSRLAYTNSGSSFGSPSATVLNSTDVYMSYLVGDYTTPVVVDANGKTLFFTSFGINQVKYSFADVKDSFVDIGSTLNLSGGFLWSYDALLADENNFFLFPDYVEAMSSPTPGAMSPQQYQYQVLYSWVDNKGNLIRSAPSVPATVTLTVDTSVDIFIPTLRLSYKTDVVIEIYRWSTAQESFHSLLTNLFVLKNDPTVDFVVYNDGASDASLEVRELIYTTGGVLENSGAPSTSIMTLWDDRLWMVSDEDKNQLWYSKQVIEAVPVEMSELLTYFVAPAIGSQGPTGPVTGLSPLDDKLVIFKEAAIEYINGAGPDNTGANNNYSQPIFVTATAGCISHRSIAMIPIGLLFQSDKGIWLLGRDLQTKYVGAPVENYTQFDVGLDSQPIVVSSVVIPDTTQVRFMLDTGVTLLYDYFFDQWSTFTGITAQSSTLFQSLHTFVDLAGNVSQETPGLYVDNATDPVLMSFQTGWINLAGLQGYERFYYFYLLGEYLSPHTLQIQLGYDYLTVIEQTDIITPAQIAPIPPDPRLGDIEQWRIFPHKGKCQAFQITFTEQSDTAGPGLTLSGLDIVVGKKKGYPVRRQNLSVGS